MKYQALLLMALLGMSQALKINQKNGQNKANKLAQNKASSKGGHECDAIINRFKTEQKFKYRDVISSSTPWTDPSFPTKDAIFWPENGYNSGRLNAYANSVWKRAYTTLKDVVLYRDDSLILGDIVQGALGDCYFLSPLAAIGEIPERLSSIFRTSKITSSGIFSAQVYVRGVAVVYSVDDFLPTNPKNGKLVFNMQGRDGTIWASMMEKLWAKMNGNYDNIIGGSTQETFSAILGAPAINYMMEDLGYNSSDSFTWAKVMNHVEEIIEGGLMLRYPMTASSGLGPNPFGLVEGHAHTILGVYYLKGKNDQVTNVLYKMKNPWGIDSYAGKWHDEDPRWTDSFKSQVNFVSNINDGIFYIENKDFIHAFESFVVSYYFDEGKITTVEIENDDYTPTYFSFEYNLDWDLYVIVDFYGEKMYPRDCRDDSSEGRISIYAEDGTPIIQNFYIWDYEITNSLYFEELQHGNYVAKIEMLTWDDVAVPDYTFKTYSNDKIPIRVLNSTEEKEFNTKILAFDLQHGMTYADIYNTYPNPQFMVHQGFFVDDTVIIKIVAKPEFAKCSLITLLVFINADQYRADLQTSSEMVCSPMNTKGSTDCTCNLMNKDGNSCSIAYFPSENKKFNIQLKSIHC